MESARNGTDDKLSSALTEEDWGTALRPYGVKLPPRVATVTRAHITLDECLEQPLYQKSRTQFLASNYIGEMAVISGAWIAGGTEDGASSAAEEQVMFLADPKPIGKDLLKVTESTTKGDKSDAPERDHKSFAASKGIDSDEGRGDKQYGSNTSSGTGSGGGVRRTEFDRK